MTSIFDKPTLGDILHNYRKKNSMSRKVLADRLGVTLNTVVHWEDNSYQPSLRSLVKIADELNMPLTELYKIRNRA